MHERHMKMLRVSLSYMLIIVTKYVPQNDLSKYITIVAKTAYIYIYIHIHTYTPHDMSFL